MSNYTPVTNFTAKDAMPSGTAAKKVKGVDFDGEFNAISLMSTEKADIASPTFTGIVTAPIATLTTITAGSINATSLDLQNNEKIQLGATDQLEIYVDSAGNNSIIKETGDGALSLRGNEVTIKNPSGTKAMAFFSQNAAATLYYNGVAKLATTSTGALVSGSMSVTSALYADSILMPDNKVVSLGTFGDFNMVHNGTDTVFTSGTGILKYTSDTAGSAATVFQIDNTNTDIVSGCFIEFKDSLGYTPPRVGALGPTLLTLVNGVTRTEVKATGLEVTGNVTATGVTATDTLVVDKDANGILTEFKIGSSVCGAVRAATGTQVLDITVGSADTSLRYAIAAGGAQGNISPAKMSDNTSNPAVIDLGRAGSNFDNIYAANGTINTSDATEKQSIEELTEAETRVAVVCKGLIRKFKWNSAVEKKGVDGARYHFGVIAQDLQAAFAAEGLDAGDYGLFISSTFTDDNGVEQTKLGVRYTELLAFIIGGLV